jgi:hypothetical protein
MRAAALLLLATGCRDLLAIEDAIPAELSYREVGTGGVVAGSFEGGLPFELHFPDGDGFHFPNALLIDGVDVMGHDPGQSCSEEDEVGIQLSPTPRISASGGAPRVTNLLTPVMRGPAVVQVKLDWSTRLACNSDRNPGGTSTFTVFSDGRIVRFDQLADPSSAPLSAFECACDGVSNSFTVSTFWTIVRGSFTSILHSGQPNTPQPLPGTSGTVEILNTATQCLDDGAQQVAFAWHGDSRGTTVRGSDQLIGFGFDFQFEDSVLPAFTWEKSSALFLGRSGCRDALARAMEHIQPSTLTINGVALAPSSRDGIYGGDAGSGEPGLELGEGDHFELTGLVRTPYAVWLRFPRSVSSLRATRAGATGSWYVPQRQGDRSWIVWFKDPLQAGQTISIEPG